MTDPVLDNPGGWYHFGYGTFSKKTSVPSIGKDQIGTIDLILLSHHQHKDNFDKAGKAFAKDVDQIVTTKPAARKLSNACGLDNWESIVVGTSLVPGLKITAVPAQHHPWWLPQFFAGKVIGFIIEWEGQENGAYYISGDTVYFKGIEEIASRYTIDVGIIHLGSVQFRYLTGKGKYTFDVKSAAKAADFLDINTFIPVHYSGWMHFKEAGDKAKSAFNATHLTSKILWLTSGVETALL